MTLGEMIEDLQALIDKDPSKSKLIVDIYCGNCDCFDNYNGATATDIALQIVINKND